MSLPKAHTRVNIYYTENRKLKSLVVMLEENPVESRGGESRSQREVKGDAIIQGPSYFYRCTKFIAFVTFSS